MNDLQDRLLRDLQAQAEHVTPASVPRCTCPQLPAGQTRIRWRRDPRRFPAWVTPLAAAAAVSVVLLGIFTAVQAVHHPAPVTAAAPTASRPTTSPLPRDWHSSAVVARTATGAVVATLHAPQPYTFEDDTSGDCAQSISQQATANSCSWPPAGHRVQHPEHGRRRCAGMARRSGCSGSRSPRPAAHG